MPNHKHNRAPLAAGVGLAALAAAAAGADYVYGSKYSGRHRRHMKSWAVKARGEVMERIENMKDVSQTAYEAAIAQVVSKYQKLKNVPPEELAAMASELKGHWNNIKRSLQSPAAPARARKKPARLKATAKEKQ